MDNVASVQALDQAVEYYGRLVAEGVPALTAAVTLKDIFGVTLDQLHDALVARGLLKSYGA